LVGRGKKETRSLRKGKDESSPRAKGKAMKMGGIWTKGWTKKALIKIELFDGRSEKSIRGGPQQNGWKAVSGKLEHSVNRKERTILGK